MNHNINSESISNILQQHGMDNSKLIIVNQSSIGESSTEPIYVICTNQESATKVNQIANEIKESL